MPESEDELVRRAAEGEDQALTVLLERNAQQVRQNLLGKIDQRWRSVLSVDDVMQETFAEAFLSIKRFVSRGDGSFLRWLNTLARNNMLDAIRGLRAAKNGGDRIRLQAASTESSHIDLIHEISASTTTPSLAATRREAAQLLDQAIALLPLAYRDVVRLYDLEGHSAVDVARDLGCSAGAMYMRRARAHALLQELMGPQTSF